MKKFKISLGVLVQQNYEIEIEAENEEEAIKLGIEAFKDGDERGEIVDFGGAEAQEDFDEDTKSGISAEEVDDCKEDEREPEIRRGMRLLKPATEISHAMRISLLQRHKNSEKIEELKAEFEKLQQRFAPDIDGFIDFLAEKIIKLEEEVDWKVRLWWGEKNRKREREVEEFNKQNKATKNNFINFKKTIK